MLRSGTNTLAGLSFLATVGTWLLAKWLGNRLKNIFGSYPNYLGTERSIKLLFSSHDRLGSLRTMKNKRLYCSSSTSDAANISVYFDNAGIISSEMKFSLCDHRIKSTANAVNFQVDIIIIHPTHRYEQPSFKARWESEQITGTAVRCEMHQIR